MLIRFSVGHFSWESSVRALEECKFGGGIEISEMVILGGVLAAVCLYG